MSKIFNIGFNKSGTTSLTRACEILGFKCLHYYFGDRRLCDLIEQNKNCDRPLLQSLDEYDFFSDFEGKKYLKTLDAQYPGSKFILTVRDLEEWLDSREKHVMRNQQNPNYRYDFLTVDRKAWAREYQEYQTELDAYFEDRAADYLIMNISAGGGWSKLAPFLEKEIPMMPFPRENPASKFEPTTNL